MPTSIARLRAAAAPLPDSERWLVPESVVKDVLEESGVAVPRRLTLPATAAPDAFRAGLPEVGEPAVLKAWGAGVVHKTELGAVDVGVDADTIDAAVLRMRQRLSQHALEPDGFLLEQLVPAGVEVLVGIVDAAAFGQVVALGLGGTAVEVLDEVVTRLCPITREDAAAMVASFRGSALLRGHRGQAPVDVDALIDLLYALAGPDGVAARLGPALAELECNPVLVSDRGAFAADARLILHAETEAAEEPIKPFGLEGLFAPRSVAIVGASTSKTTVANRTLRNYRARGWTRSLYAIHPTAAEIEGVPAYASVAQIPEPVDYLALMVPAAACPEIVRAAKGRARFVHVLSSGFGETGGEGARLQDDLLDAVRDSAVRLIGPNSLGVFSAGSGQTWGGGLPRESGRIGGAFQSGGVSTSVLQMGPAAGVHFGKAVSTGNGIDVTVGEVASYFLDDPDTDVIALYVEGGADRQLVDTLRRARGRKPVVVLAPGLTDAGARAAASHTGALTGGRRAWAAVETSTGAVIVETIESFLAVLGQVVAHQAIDISAEPSTLIVGNGGGASVMAVDACDAAGLPVPPCVEAAEALGTLGLTSGVSFANPVDVPIFQGTAPELLADVVRAALGAQSFSDVLLHVDVAPYYALGNYRDDLPGSTHLLQVAAALTPLARSGRLSVVVRNLDCAPAADADQVRSAFRAAGVPVHRTFAEAAGAIAAVQRLSADRKGVS
ncbi:acetate--CoA ligase family protein [Sporichthya brevicatena]